MAAFGSLGKIRWRKIILSYDNMCHLDNLIAAKSPLPLSGDLKYIWYIRHHQVMATTFKHSAIDSLLQVIDDFYAIIDGLHVWNHRDQSCRPK